MKIIEFNKNQHSFDWLMKEMQALHESDGIDLLICIYKKKDGKVGFGTTRGNNAEMLGLFELGKSQLIDEMYD